MKEQLINAFLQLTTLWFVGLGLALMVGQEKGGKKYAYWTMGVPTLWLFSLPIKLLRKINSAAFRSVSGQSGRKKKKKKK